jgi:hypothetical protein
MRDGAIIVVVPAINAEELRSHPEAFQVIVWHCQVSNPALAAVGANGLL